MAVWAASPLVLALGVSKGPSKAVVLCHGFPAVEEFVNFVRRPALKYTAAETLAPSTHLAVTQAKARQAWQIREALAGVSRCFREPSD